jgi:hypothetical protein
MQSETRKQMDVQMFRCRRQLRKKLKYDDSFVEFGFTRVGDVTSNQMYYLVSSAWCEKKSKRTKNCLRRSCECCKCYAIMTIELNICKVSLRWYLHSSTVQLTHFLGAWSNLALFTRSSGDHALGKMSHIFQALNNYFELTWESDKWRCSFRHNGTFTGLPVAVVEGFQWLRNSLYIFFSYRAKTVYKGVWGFNWHLERHCWKISTQTLLWLTFALVRRKGFHTFQM